MAEERSGSNFSEKEKDGKVNEERDQVSIDKTWVNHGRWGGVVFDRITPLFKVSVKIACLNDWKV